MITEGNFPLLIRYFYLFTRYFRVWVPFQFYPGWRRFFSFLPRVFTWITFPEGSFTIILSNCCFYPGYPGYIPLSMCCQMFMILITDHFLFSRKHKPQKKKTRKQFTTRWITILKRNRKSISIIWNGCSAYITRVGIFRKNIQTNIGHFIYRIQWCMISVYIYLGYVVKMFSSGIDNRLEIVFWRYSKNVKYWKN